MTTTQDYSLFHILSDYSIGLWKRQISLIREQNDLISFLVHPDYIMNDPARRVYMELLEYICQLREHKETWMALPREVTTWWQLRNELDLVPKGSSWRMVGKGCERARLAYAVPDGDRFGYEVE